MSGATCGALGLTGGIVIGLVARKGGGAAGSRGRSGSVERAAGGGADRAGRGMETSET